MSMDDAVSKPHDRLAEALADDLTAVNHLIRQRMASEHAPRIPEVTAHLVEAGGKRLRPMLTLATARMCGYAGPYHIHLAATVEFIHTATFSPGETPAAIRLRAARQTSSSNSRQFHRFSSNTSASRSPHFTAAEAVTETALDAKITANGEDATALVDETKAVDVADAKDDYKKEVAPLDAKALLRDKLVSAKTDEYDEPKAEARSDEQTIEFSDIDVRLAEYERRLAEAKQTATQMWH